jgi:hypothetical protein
MKKVLSILLTLTLMLQLVPGFAGDAELRLSMASYRDKVRAAWLGKMAGVSVGILREFWFKGEIGPEDQVPKWDETLLSLASVEDDLYIPFVLLQVMDQKGIDISGKEMAIALYPYSFEFWDGHQRTWEEGIAPPDAGHPAYAPFPDGLSYSFAADYSGLIAPGRPDIPMELAGRFGSMLVYGDGIYGGSYIGAMYSEAFFTTDRKVIVEKALMAVPGDSWLHESISDVLACYELDPNDWEAAWRKITDKYYVNSQYNWIQWPYGGRLNGIDLDAKLNCAYMTISLLYGGGDIEKTLNLAIRCGQDCDCNAANALGVLFASIGYEILPETYKAPLNTFPPVRYANAGFEELCTVTERVAREAMKNAGASFITENGEEIMLIPAAKVEPGKAQNSKTPAPLTGSLFTKEEMARLERPQVQDGGFEEDWHDAIYLPWMLAGSGSGGVDMRNGKAYNGKNNAWLCAQNGKMVWLTQNRIMVEPNAKYVLTAAIRTSGNVEDGFLRIMKSGKDGKAIAQTIYGTQKKYTLVTLSLETGNTAHVDVQIGYTGPGASSWMQIDEVSLVKAE